MTEWIVRPAALEERRKLLRLLRQSFGSAASHWSEDYWRWKHEANPFGPSYVLIAEAGDRPVGMRVFLRWELRSGEHRVPAVRAVDTATHPEVRRRGVFSQLTREALEAMEAERISFVFNTPNSRSRPGYLQLGWRPVGRVPLLVRPLRPLRMLLPASAKQPPRLDHFATAADFLSSSDADLPRLGWQDRRLHTERTRAYLTWRYGQIPGRTYRVLWERRNDEAAALWFHARRRRRRQEVTLSEVLMTPGAVGRQLATGLLHTLAREASADYLVASVAANTPERVALREAGFLPLPRLGPHLTVRPVCPGLSPVDPCTWEAWRCSIGDLEIF